MSGLCILLCVHAVGLGSKLPHIHVPWPLDVMASDALLMSTLATPQPTACIPVGLRLILAALGNNQHDPSLAGVTALLPGELQAELHSCLEQSILMSLRTNRNSF